MIAWNYAHAQYMILLESPTHKTATVDRSY